MSEFGPTLTSLHNPWVKLARSLHARKHRQRERAFLVEGVRAVRDGLAAGFVPRLVLVDPGAEAGPEALAVARSAWDLGARVHLVTQAILRAVSDTETPQGLVAVFPFPDLELQSGPDVAFLGVVADAIRDPGNLGTLIRSALGAGAHAIFCTPGTVDPFAPKVVRAGIGAHFRLPIRQLDWSDPDPLLLACEQRLAADAGATRTYDAVDWTVPSCLMVGNETRGITPEARAFATDTVAIPLAGGLESLNAGIAGSVILFEAARQRRISGDR